MAQTSARVNLVVSNNATWEDAFQFGTVGDTSWDLTGQRFRMDVKASRDDTTALFTLSTANGRIVVDDVVQRVIHFNVADTVLAAALPPSEYVYDLVMYDNSTPTVRVQLMHGEVRVRQGVTGD